MLGALTNALPLAALRVQDNCKMVHATQGSIMPNVNMIYSTRIYLIFAVIPLLMFALGFLASTRFRQFIIGHIGWVVLVVIFIGVLPTMLYSMSGSNC